MMMAVATSETFDRAWAGGYARAVSEPSPTPVVVHAGQLVRLRESGRNEHWLHDWLVGDLTRLGLGELKLVGQEQTQAGGGNLDILAGRGRHLLQRRGPARRG
jgi:hypothetical protein